jgi:hypothetical protein
MSLWASPASCVDWSISSIRKRARRPAETASRPIRPELAERRVGWWCGRVARAASWSDRGASLAPVGSPRDREGGRNLSVVRRCLFSTLSGLWTPAYRASSEISVCFGFTKEAGISPRPP